jgi:hypothetical protein
MKRTRWVRHVAHMQEIKIEYRILVEKLARRKLLMRLLHRHRTRNKDVLVNTLVSQLSNCYLLKNISAPCSLMFLIIIIMCACACMKKDNFTVHTLLHLFS